MFTLESFAGAWPMCVIFMFIATGYYVILKSRPSCRRQVLPPPGNSGETFMLFTTLPDKFVGNHRKKYDILSSYLIRHPTVIVSTIDANKFFLEQEGSKFCKASKLKSMRNTLWPHQVNQANDDLHRRFYKLILAHMVPEVLKQKVQKFDESARRWPVRRCAHCDEARDGKVHISWDRELGLRRGSWIHKT
ncbi:uncharacterized protein LOC112351266 [Selaginella moellendorffii]|uniref:uncharacterized protein LOC112351266 n=1 Tax=Selaginella moellendorffii TaxID=88036 RepID=UPI000D1CC668|nr:uncharacterized protein LOC112351266 [Selaginella moellendorffii]|eukprot:XP_024544559.1 uncharacterized protein LOC112351266 [Selaginella moellendorffii]